MKRENLIARKKVKNNKHLFKDSKILNFYKKFKSIIFKDIKDKSFALAVSGGSDSLCLAYFSKIYSSEFDNKIHILIVDHNLRKESYKEALIVKEILRKRRIESTILRWKGKIPKNNIQKNARDLRYLLISNYCLKKNIKYLIKLLIFLDFFIFSRRLLFSFFSNFFTLLQILLLIFNDF